MKCNIDIIIEGLLADLSPRQRDVIIGRFGLETGDPMTLAAIGDKYNVTRERIRQVEALALTQIKPGFEKGELAKVVAFIYDHLTTFHGVRSNADLKNDFQDSLFSSTPATYENKVAFIMEGSGRFSFHAEDNDYNAFWYLTKENITKADEVIERIYQNIKNRKSEVLSSNQFEVVFSDAKNGFHYSDTLVTNYLGISKKFAHNVYNDFGLSEWSEIVPKTSRDWAYLVLRKNGKPLHFIELTERINEIRPNKKTNAQTVHNELIKDDRFVLVGRGTYGLKEFNIMAGTAREVITQILKKNGPQTSRNLIKLVLEERMFKENTLILNLQDKKYFQRNIEGKYQIREA